MNSFESAGAFAGDAYDIDDAFSDSEDPVASFHLNPETIRAELSKSMPQSIPEADTATTATANGFFEAEDTVLRISQSTRYT
ncbi:hypothetical protein ONZ45_g19710 [Pleurotus djamor]|nr:hypothetical protein ONZ45_g19710 [Pleurotus djamor]